MGVIFTLDPNEGRAFTANAREGQSHRRFSEGRIPYGRPPLFTHVELCLIRSLVLLLHV